jgi:two-component system, response regulator YesN
MLKVVIADDERKVRNAIIKLGDWEGIGLKIVGEVQDGDMLCEIIASEMPDIVITDMKMPGICGSELIKKLSDEYKNIKIIIVSGFDDFQYTKQAISSKVLDYILKPVDGENLNSALRNAVSEFQVEKNKSMENQYLKTMVNEMLPVLKGRFFNKFVNGQEVSEEELLRWRGLPQINQKSFYKIAIMIIENYQQKCASLLESRNLSLDKVVVDSANQHCCNESAICFKNEKYENEVIIVFYENCTNEVIFSIIDDVKNNLYNNYNLKIFSGIGGTYHNYQSIRNSFYEARAALTQINIMEYRRIVFFEDITSYSRNLTKNISKNEEMFLMAIENGNIELLRHAIIDTFDSYKDLEYVNIKDIRKLNYDIIILLERLINNVDEKFGFSNEIFLLRENIGNELDLEAIKQYILEFVEKVSKFISNKKLRREKKSFHRIKDYIDENYTTKISLSDLSKKYFMSEEYISRMFKEQFEINPFEYITTLRINKAKTLLADNGMKVREIVEILGFTDESHFSKAFKKHTGMTPKIYRENNLITK